MRRACVDGSSFLFGSWAMLSSRPMSLLPVQEWVQRTHQWPPSMIKALVSFLSLT